MANFLNKLLHSSIHRTTGNILRKFSSESVHVSSSNSKWMPQLVHSVLENNWIYKRNEIIQTPINQKHHIDLPRSIIYPITIEDPSKNNIVMEEPPQIIENHIEAARLIVIRRQKMKNHKLKKLRKRLRFERAKIRQKRELKKEKEFQAVLIQQCKEAETFSAEEYVQSRIQKYKEALVYVPKERKTFYD
ncbi:hypothetical protein HHI36_007848 [Cryptolaemus montrouzieri]|uniref:Ribosomal protein mS38 C-terminal domain-containing protein n=1 Tax=Cryptolaemus montrouzieri TaxID=559131 RepID=A0ABD2MQS4_9CUCU